MNEQYLKAAKAINEVALFLAAEGYHVTTSFGRDCESIEVIVYFYNYLRKKQIEHLLSCYTKENDKIEYDCLMRDNGDKFHILKLTKHLL